MGNQLLKFKKCNALPPNQWRYSVTERNPGPIPCQLNKSSPASPAVIPPPIPNRIEFRTYILSDFELWRKYNGKKFTWKTNPKSAPDLILGYNRCYRSSWDTILGEYPRSEFVDNNDKWSGDHCMDNIFLPGVFLCSKKFGAAQPALYDLAPSILSEFGIGKPKSMIGKSIFG